MANDKFKWDFWSVLNIVKLVSLGGAILIVLWGFGDMENLPKLIRDGFMLVILVLLLIWHELCGIRDEIN